MSSYRAIARWGGQGTSTARQNTLLPQALQHAAYFYNLGNQQRHQPG
ncbi:hypothetical protein [aff. Roholtiella sp. LEGE 12411]|nr:hypothetical protein [aff. Roholtiella sp. LEGE 12411]MBE9035504.1 hypothetical protein [aff. Roholtiella sp. LEGE 12411]